MRDNVSRLMFNILKTCTTFTMIYYFYNKNDKTFKELVPNSHYKMKYVIHIKHWNEALNRGLILD